MTPAKQLSELLGLDSQPVAVAFRDSAPEGVDRIDETAPSGCTATTNPPAMPVWQTPVALPPTASVYQCDVGVIRAGTTEPLSFEVAKRLGTAS